MKLTPSEYILMDILWDIEPINSGKLVELCKKNFNWEKSTTYTFIKRLKNKNIIVNENSILTSRYKRIDYQSEKSKKIVDDIFNGSLAKFLYCYFKNHQLSNEEIDELETLFKNS